MYLLNTSTIELEEFQGSNIPQYVILSHRWGTKEVSFYDVKGGRGPELAKSSKIRSCCAQAVRDGWKYAWIDSCCIDKSSSAELSEAINSMFQWYRNAQVCYAYLSDVPSGEEDHYLPDSAFRRSEWFTRGWTLQELLAPSIVTFFDQEWHEIGTKSSLESLISFITSIESLPDFYRSSVAQKMSWASKRQTTRVEDMAYCLLGLFGLNMTPMYGEGERAFTRLQLEILDKIDDESVFAWTSTDIDRDRGLLARSPASFQRSGDIGRFAFNPNRPEYSMTNKGLRIEVVLHPVDIHTALGTSFFAPLNCARKGKHNPVGIYLKRKQWEQFERRDAHKLDSLILSGQGTTEIIYVRQSDDLSLGFYELPGPKRPCRFLVNADEFLTMGFSISKRYLLKPGDSYWEEGQQGSSFTYQLVLRPSDDHKYTYGALLFADQILEPGDIICTDDNADMFVVLLKSDHTYGRAWVNLFVPEARYTLKQNVQACNEALSSPSRSIDRMSTLLQSGRSVSVALRKIGLSEMDTYIVEITIDETGRLDWAHGGLRRPT